MTTLIALDPGLRNAGIAVFTDATLTYAGLVRNPEKKARGLPAWSSMSIAAASAVKPYYSSSRPDLFVGEVMQHYASRYSKVDVADLLELNGVVGAVSGRIEAVSTASYLPREWKGQLAKEVMGARVLDILSDVEKSRIAKCAESLRHNVIDAIGIGLFHLGRY